MVLREEEEEYRYMRELYSKPVLGGGVQDEDPLGGLDSFTLTMLIL